MGARLFFVCTVIFAASPLFAREKTDVLVMKNGDHITCEIKGLDTDTLYIKIPYILNTLSLDWSEVDHIESKQLFIVKTLEGLVYTGTLSTSENPAGRPMKIEIQEASEKKVALESNRINTMTETSNNVWQRFSGDFGMGFTYSKGNQAAQYNIGSGIYYSQLRWGAGASYNSNLSSSSGSSPSTRNEIALSAERLFPGNDWYYRGLSDFLQSSVEGIRLQSTLGGGVGRYLKNTSHTSFSVAGGFAWQQINYHQAISAATQENVASGLIATNLKLFRFDKTTLNVSANLFPAISDPGRVHLNLNASYYVKLWRNLKWNATFYGNWDSQPPPGFTGSDYGSTSGLSWTFGNK